jgi:hypothetical protein
MEQTEIKCICSSRTRLFTRRYKRKQGIDRVEFNFNKINGGKLDGAYNV